MLRNAFNEIISKEEIESFTARIKTLPLDKIDELWYKCGFIINGHEEDNLKALRKHDLEKFTKGEDDAKTVVSFLLKETKKEIVEANLKKLEQENGKA